MPPGGRKSTHAWPQLHGLTNSPLPLLLKAYVPESPTGTFSAGELHQALCITEIGVRSTNSEFASATTTQDEVNASYKPHGL